MRHSTIIQRFRVYAKCIVVLLVAIAIGVMLFFLLPLIHGSLAIVSFVWIVLVVAGFPFYVSHNLNLITKSIMFALPVMIASLGLLFFKVGVNESAFRSCLDNPPSLLNYLGFYCWTSILLWEIYLMFYPKQQPITSASRNGS